MTPSQRYQTLQQRPDFEPDPAQQRALAALDRLHAELRAGTAPWRRRKPVPGLYLWGPVGRGKTLLMDLFKDSLPEGLVLRLHFHRFMARVHRELTELSGTADPLQRIARQIASRHRVLCFDEFQVTDIADAMLIGRLLAALFQRGLVMVATSNQSPDELYRDGLQRDRFFPTVRLLHEHLQVHNLDGGRDHRHRRLDREQTIFPHPADDRLGILFRQQAGIDGQQGAIAICGRPVPARRHGAGVAWFDFAALCEGPRSALDYIWLAQRYHTLLLGDVPVFDGEVREWIKARGTEDSERGSGATGERQVRWSAMDDPARRFISFVDELYERNVRLYLSTRAPLDTLYRSGRLEFEFRRTRSRLIEMQSRDYLLRGHRP
ncbi:cell division protein ZapE [Marinobacterium nitratireducens]|uniref:Cell division protein ZapE n=1 Tax=Marinobacterium nitratireducens TaxID=518897 RepID=A0A917ZP99_9GAMM|nr:cell division protein ZapE [Marinobacterium nitratireducens]GGO88672.1 cell division protein ZapE [Marinobacterium nitratireducens]